VIVAVAVAVAAVVAGLPVVVAGVPAAAVVVVVVEPLGQLGYCCFQSVEAEAALGRAGQ
jgi:hypothetical protein